MAQVGRRRARSVDREHAVELLNTAYADGRLTSAEREDRVARALAAKHLGDLARLTSDIRPDPQPTSREPDGWWQRGPRRTRLAIGAAALAMGGGGLTVAVMLDDGNPVAVAEEAPYVVPASVEAVEELIAAQEAEFGTTRSYGMSLQVQLTTVAVPTADGRARYQPWRPREDGGFEPAGEVRGAGEYREFDLAGVDLAALDANIDEARATLEVPEPTHLSLVIEHWEADDEARISITVGNDYDEYGYIVTDLSGTPLERSPFDPRP